MHVTDDHVQVASPQKRNAHLCENLCGRELLKTGICVRSEIAVSSEVYIYIRH